MTGSLLVLPDAMLPGLAVLCLWLLLLPATGPDRRWARLAVIGVALGCIGWYLGWRWTATFPDGRSGAETMWQWIFLGIETLSLGSSALSLGFLAKRRDRVAEADKICADWSADPDRATPRVDLFIPTLSEPKAVLERTLVAARAIRWEGLRIFVLDDGERPWLRDLCREQGVAWLARSEHAHAKAGNLNHALKETAGDPAPLILVLDADFIAMPDILERMVPVLQAEPRMGILQTPQHFYNPDPIQVGLLASDRIFDEQRFFFDTIQPAKDAWGCAFFCGTGALIRRAALHDIGGFGTESVTEDALTSYKIAGHGWYTGYLNERLAVGLAPEGLAEYIGQRGRWCLGALQQIHTRWGPLGRGPMPLRMRVSLVDALLYWMLAPVFRLVITLAPLMYWFADLYAIRAPSAEVIEHVLPLAIGILGAFAWLSDARLLPVVNDVAHYVSMPTVMRAVWTGLVQPWGHRFRTTAKGVTRARVTVQWPLLIFFSGIALLIMAGVLLALANPTAPTRGEGFAVNLFWSALVVLMLVLSAGTCIEAPRPRASPRVEGREVVELETGEEVRPVRLLDISLDGAGLRTDCDDVRTGQRIRLHLPGVGWLRALVVHCRPGHLGICFQGDDMARRNKRARLIRYVYSPRHRLQVGQARLGAVGWLVLSWFMR